MSRIDARLESIVLLTIYTLKRIQIYSVTKLSYHLQFLEHFILLICAAIINVLYILILFTKHSPPKSRFTVFIVNISSFFYKNHAVIWIDSSIFLDSALATVYFCLLIQRYIINIYPCVVLWWMGIDIGCYCLGWIILFVAKYKIVEDDKNLVYISVYIYELTRAVFDY